jgi:hypothetical protein
VTERVFSRPGWQVEAHTRTMLTCDAENFYVHANLDAYEDGRRIHSGNWTETIERKLV